MKTAKEDIKSEAKQQLDQAWLLARRMRCCPPDKILFGDVEKDKALEDHLRDCQSCSQARLDFPDGINIKLPEIKNKKNSLSPGELWSISADMRGWGEKNRYYNPPVVLITADAGGYGFTVVQTFCDMLLAGEDDIALNGEANELTGFAQPWNRYTLHRNNFDIYLGRVSEPCLQEVILALDNEPAEIKPGSLLWFFRHMEVETGWYFSRQAYPVLMDAYETAVQSEDDEITVSSLRIILDGQPVIMPDIHFDESELESFLYATQPDDSLLSLAAADAGEEESVQALVFAVGASSSGKERVKALTCHIKTYIEDGYLLVDGVCEENPGEDCQWFFRWSGGNWSVSAIKEESGGENKRFWAVFPVEEIPDNEKGSLNVRILVSG